MTIRGSWLTKLFGRQGYAGEKETPNPEIKPIKEPDAEQAEVQSIAVPSASAPHTPGMNINNTFGQVDQESMAQVEARVAEEWKVGDVILDTYEVKGIHEGGGMGLVYRVHHHNWNIDLAVKSPRKGFFQTQEQKDNFVRECETWINLGLYPHIVSCYYVRTLGGIPRVFAEYVEGGTLKECIESRKLYEGGPEKAIERILDIAIEMAWGLRYAHDKGLIHQDVKPANVLMMPDGAVKITDWGLAKARVAVGEKYVPGSGRSILVSTGGMTPAYCSPEQARGEPLSHKTDIWSWAVSVLEMFTGEVTWRAGQAAGSVLDAYLETGEADPLTPKMPMKLAEIMRGCFRPKADERMSLDMVGTVLGEIYQQVMGRDYERSHPRPVDLVADSLNNHALSLTDLGKHEEAERLWNDALRADPQHVPSVFNHGLLLWRSARLTDNELLKKLEALQESHPGDWLVKYAMAQIHLERSDAKSAISLLEETKQHSGFEVGKTLLMAQKALPDIPRCVRQMHGHTDWVLSVGFSRDGRVAISAGRDKTLRLWDVTTGKCHCTLRHDHKIACSAISPDGQLAVSGCGERISNEETDTRVTLWDLRNGKRLRSFEGHSQPVTCVSFTSDGRSVISGGLDGTLRLWDIASGKCLRILEDNKGKISSLCVTRNGQLALSGSDDGTARLWEVTCGKCLRVLDSRRGVMSAGMSSDGRWAVLGSYGGHLQFWDISNGKCVREIKACAQAITSLAIGADGRLVLSACMLDNAIRIWELPTLRCLRTLDGHTDPVFAVAFGGKEDAFLSGGVDSTLRLWEMGGCLKSVSTYSASPFFSRVVSAASSMTAQGEFAREIVSAQKFVARSDYAGALRSLQTARNQTGYERHAAALELQAQVALQMRKKKLNAAWCRLSLLGHTGPVTTVKLSPDARWLISGSLDKTFRLWDVQTGECLRNVDAQGMVSSVDMTPDGALAVSGCGTILPVGKGDSVVRLWELTSGKLVREYVGHSDEVNAVAFSPDGKWIVSASKDKTMRLWESSTGRCLRIFVGHGDWVLSVCMSVNGRWILSGGGNIHNSRDDSLRLWNVVTGALLRTLVGHVGFVSSVCLNRDSRWALSASLGGAPLLWDLPTGGQLTSLKGHQDRVQSVQMGLHPPMALTGSDDGTVRLWEVPTGRCLYVLEGHEGWVGAVDLSANCRWAISGGWDGVVKIWELDWQLEAVAASDWNEGARPYVRDFLTLHTPYAADLPKNREPKDEEITLALTRRGKPSWTDDDFKQLLYTLGCAGLGWLRPEGVRRELEKMSRECQWLPALPEG